MGTTGGTVQIRRVDENDVAALYHRYPSQSQPQPVRLCLNLLTGDLYCEINGEIGNGVPIAIWDGRIRTWGIPQLRAAAANALMQAVAADAQRLLAGSEVDRDGNGGWRVTLDEAAQAAEWEIGSACEASFGEHDSLLQVWDASDWYSGLGDRSRQRQELGISSTTTDTELQAIVDNEEVDVLAGGLEYLQDLRDRH
jgi:hypothetical protein